MPVFFFFYRCRNESSTSSLDRNDTLYSRGYGESRRTYSSRLDRDDTTDYKKVRNTATSAHLDPGFNSQDLQMIQHTEKQMPCWWFARWTCWLLDVFVPLPSALRADPSWEREVEGPVTWHGPGAGRLEATTREGHTGTPSSRCYGWSVLI